MFYIHVHTTHSIKTPIEFLLTSYPLFEMNKVGKWRVHKINDDGISCMNRKHGINNNEIVCKLAITGWANFDTWIQIGWRFVIQLISIPALTMEFTFTSKPIENALPNMVRGWFRIDDNGWLNIDESELSQNRAGPLTLDALIVDRKKDLKLNTIMRHLTNMMTKKGLSVSILDNYKYPFYYDMLKFKDESGIDFGALSNEYFQSVFKLLSRKIALKLDEVIVRAFIRMWIMCLKIKSRFNTFVLECRMPESYFNPLYFEIVFGKLDELIALQEERKFISFLFELSKENIVASWLPEFVQKYLLSSDGGMEGVDDMLSSLQL